MMTRGTLPHSWREVDWRSDIASRLKKDARLEQTKTPHIFSINEGINAKIYEERSFNLNKVSSNLFQNMLPSLADNNVKINIRK
jgi:hypothetical protein